MSRISKGFTVKAIMAIMITIALLGLCSCGGGTQAQAPADFAGVWSWSDSSDYFDITLKVEGSKLTGWHEGGLNDASRVDAVLESEEPSINGTIEGNVAKLAIKSAYSPDVIDEATLTITGKDEAMWKVTTQAAGEAYIPLEAKLSRQAAAASPMGLEQLAPAAEEKIIASGTALKEGLESDIARLGIEPILANTKGTTEGGEAEVYRDGDTLLMIKVSLYGETGSLVSTYWFGPGNSLELVERTMSTIDPATGEPAGSVETTRWYYKDSNLVCARDGQDNPIIVDSPDTNEVREAVLSDLAEYSDIGLGE